MLTNAEIQQSNFGLRETEEFYLLLRLVDLTNILIRKIIKFFIMLYHWLKLFMANCMPIVQKA